MPTIGYILIYLAVGSMIIDLSSTLLKAIKNHKNNNQPDFTWIKLTPNYFLIPENDLFEFTIARREEPDYVYLYFYKDCLIATEEVFDNYYHEIKSISNFKTVLSEFLYTKSFKRDVSKVVTDRMEIFTTLIKVIKEHKREIEANQIVFRCCTSTYIKNNFDKEIMNLYEEAN